MRLRHGILMTALVPLLTGCSTLRATFDGWGSGPDGLSRPQRELREALSGGNFPVALAWKEDDALLRALTTGATAYYAAQYARSAALLDTAALLTEERITTSVSKNALSLVTNDLARPYAPRRTERLFVPYYAMLAYSQLGQWEDAAVEARRMVLLLQRFAPDREDGERGLHAAMHYLAGSVFERAGERDAAAVAYRNAHALVDTYPERPVEHADAAGDVLVVIERGFVAHRANETIRIALGDDDRHELRESDESRRRVVDRLSRGILPSATQPPVSPTSDPAPSAQPASFRQRDVPASPVALAVGSRVPPAPRHHVEHDDEDDDDDDDVRHLTLAFPSLRRSPRPWAGAPRLAPDSAQGDLGVEELRVSANVDDASSVDERRERASVVTRELARAAAKYAVTKAVRDKKGKVAGTIAEMGASLLERADVRSWHLLPQELVVLRVRLPAGQHQLGVEVGDGANLRRVALGPVTVKPGEVAVAPARFWREPAPRHYRRCEYLVAPCSP